MHKHVIFLIVWISCFVVTHAETPHLHVCAVANYKSQGLKQLKHSCKHYKVDLNVMGLGKPYTGNGQKLSYWKKFLRKIPDQDVVLFVDGFDILFLAPKETILQKFLDMDSRCVISTQQYPSPHQHLKDRYPESPTCFRFINSGAVMGYAGYLKHLLEAISPIKEKESDQGQLIYYYVDHQDEIKLDYYGAFCLTLTHLNINDLKLDIENKTLFCLITDTQPCLVHGAGMNKAGIGIPLYQTIYNQLFLSNPGMYAYHPASQVKQNYKK